MNVIDKLMAFMIYSSATTYQDYLLLRDIIYPRDILRGIQRIVISDQIIVDLRFILCHNVASLSISNISDKYRIIFVIYYFLTLESLFFLIDERKKFVR